MTRRLETNCYESLNVCTRSGVWCWYREMRVSPQRRSGKGKKKGKKEGWGGKRRETARQGTRCSRQHLKWFFYTAKEGSREREEQTTRKCEKSWELYWMDFNTSHPPRIVFSLTWDFQHRSSDSNTAKSTGPPFPLNPSPKLSLSWIDNITRLIAISAVLLGLDLAGGQNWYSRYHSSLPDTTGNVVVQYTDLWSPYARGY